MVIKEILDSRERFFKKEDIFRTGVGYEVVFKIGEHTVEVYSLESTPARSTYEIKDICLDLPPQVYRKTIIQDVSFTVDGQFDLQDMGKLAIPILNQVKFFIADILAPFTMIKMSPFDDKPQRLRAYRIFARDIARFIPGLEYIPNKYEEDGIFTVATQDIAQAIRQPVKETKKKKITEIFDSPKLYDKISWSDTIDVVSFKVGEFPVTIHLERKPLVTNLASYIKVEQGVDQNAYSKFSPGQISIIWNTFGRFPEKECFVFDLGFTVDSEYSRDILTTINGKDASKFGLQILTQIVYFLKEAVVRYRDKTYFIHFYPYDTDEKRKKTYGVFYEKIARIVPGLVPIQMRPLPHRRYIPEYVIGTQGARDFLDKMVEVPLTLKETIRIKELFDSKIDIKWHPESNDQMQVAYFIIENKIYIFRAMDSHQKNVGMESLKQLFKVPDNIKVWQVGFSYVDTSLFPDVSVEEIESYTLDELMFLINKNYLTDTGNTAVVLTGIVNILKELHSRFPEDVISFRGTEEKSRKRVYTMLVKNTKRFVSDCTGAVLDNQFFIVPDIYKKTGESV